ncbi:PEPxxWA-CTERM sorting domain-containing protein [Sandarakinorhabdus sp.]|uniref:PEPxxWA-CTERM sorting domain-containing protein n=1 Tax=Sandarakinorhabdus sp. TaxID=1916663 RepID=UPI00286D801C|nr:PEPxxWA-CTERM sorting domain-containing protein [Sandarakinorhabdus sp.]
MLRKLVITGIIGACAMPAMAANLLTNGDFESGSVAGWTQTIAGNSSGTSGVYANGANAPFSGLSTTVNANGGNFVYLTGQNGPGAYELRQAFTLASAQTVTIKFDHFANNYGGAVFSGNGLDPFAGPPVQFALVDLIAASTGAFDTAGQIQSFYSGADGGTNPNPWTSYSFNVSLAAGSYAIRFAQADNQLFFTQGVDNVFVGGAVPEPASWAMLIAGFGLVGAAARRRRAVVAA